MKVLIASASKHGSTAEIAAVIAETIRTAELEVEVADITEAPDPAGYDAAVIGSAIYVGSWMKDAVAYVSDHRAALAAIPVWLFSSGPLGEDISDLEDQPKELGGFNDWIHPREHRTFFGALDREKLGFGERMMVKAVKAPEGDFRDFDEIRAWAVSIAAALTP